MEKNKLIIIIYIPFVLMMDNFIGRYIKYWHMFILSKISYIYSTRLITYICEKFDKYINYGNKLISYGVNFILHKMFNLIKNNIYVKQYIYNKINNTNLGGRDLELFFPLFIISDLCGELDKMLEISKKIVKERKEKDVYESFDVQVYDFVSQYKEIGFIKVSELTSNFRVFAGIEEKQEQWLNSKWFGKSLKRLLLIKDKKKSSGMLVILDIEKAKEKIKIFKEPEEEDEVKTEKIK